MFRRAFAGAGATAIVTAAALRIAPSAAVAQSAGVFAGKTAQMLIGFGPGGGYDLWGRGAELAALIDRIYATPKPIVEKIGKLIQ